MSSDSQTPQEPEKNVGDLSNRPDSRIKERSMSEAPNPVALRETSLRATDRTIARSSDLWFARHVHNYVTEHIKLADQKAAFTFALATALACYLFKNDMHKMWMKLPLTWSILDAMCFSGMVGLFAGLVSACAVILPRLRKSHEGIVFFRSIADCGSCSGYASRVLQRTDAELAESLLMHAFDLSAVCCGKYRALTYALWLTCIGSILSIVTLFLYK